MGAGVRAALARVGQPAPGRLSPQPAPAPAPVPLRSGLLGTPRPGGTSGLNPRFGAARWVLATLIAVLVLAVSARLEVPVPGSPVPQSLQTMAVVLVGALMGPRRGMMALLAYLVAGAAGLPVFAGGAAGVHQLLGPTGGYLAGFVLGAGVAGLLGANLHNALLGMLLAHAVILGMGWGRLALLLGPGDAWVHGVAPFLWGGAVKSAAALCVLALLRRSPPR